MYLFDKKSLELNFYCNNNKSLIFCTIQALEGEGHDPNTIEMEVDSPVSKKTPIRKTPKTNGRSGYYINLHTNN